MLTQKQLDALAYGRRGGYWKHTEKYKKLMSEKMKKDNPMSGKNLEKHHNWKRKKVNCDYCGKEICKPPCYLKSKHHYCCMSCKRKWEAEHKKTYPYYYYGKDWLKIRDEVLKRDNFQCVNCGSRIRLEIHHKKRWLDSRDNNLENLITFCRKCHRQLE
jgi:hypothetical protein